MGKLYILSTSISFKVFAADEYIKDSGAVLARMR